ncbi:excisionase family DNA-binding protein [Acrocarpospora sp. B8E8]|uniref:excisionase family DNA-binding protein n=1 Tax=Acrocarpospora sp. B8E8 TaxID=3153572 RepID=UPI00325D7481
MSRRPIPSVADRLLTVAQAAERLNTSERFPRRLIEERRIAFVRIGRNVRIPGSALEEFIQAGVVAPIVNRKGRIA